MKERYRELLSQVELTKTELTEVRTVIQLYSIFSIGPGRDDYARFDISELYGRYEYYTLKSLYHAENFINHMLGFDFEGRRESEEYFAIGLPNSHLFFEFDSFVPACATLFENVFRIDAEKILSQESGKNFVQLHPKRNDVDGIGVRFKLIRDRLIHPDDPAFSEEGGRFTWRRYYDLVSIVDGKAEIRTELLDIKDNEFLKPKLRNSKGMRIQEILFNRNPPNEKDSSANPKLLGKGKSLKTMELVNGFDSLLSEFRAYAHGMNKIFAIEALKKLEQLAKQNPEAEIPEGNLTRLRELFAI